MHARFRAAGGTRAMSEGGNFARKHQQLALFVLPAAITQSFGFPQSGQSPAEKSLLSFIC
jgi:hypothetical protein